MSYSRREFLSTLGLSGLGLTMLPSMAEALSPAPFTFEISLAEFSYASELYTQKMTNFDFPQRALNDHGINVVEWVSGFFNNKHTDTAYMKELKAMCDDIGVKSHLIMVDGENLAGLDAARRQHAVEAHYPWVDAAKFLGCTSIRVNLGDAMAAFSGKGEEGTAADAAKAAVDGYGKLLEYAGKAGLNVIVENHFGYSSNPEWLVDIMKQLKANNKGLLPDFGNFCLERSKVESMDWKALLASKCLKEYDKYKGTEMMMPYAKGISAKTHKFNASGDDAETDFRKIFGLIKASGWTGGYVGIEYEGGLMRDFGGDNSYLSNDDGIKATKALLEKVKTELK
ncbi:MAG TPA: TIM barrel protein [Cyclobacteriaceae bacterium]|nr:TIM barrel protein [Cyclobacteriaceae bacterium]